MGRRWSCVGAVLIAVSLLLSACSQNETDNPTEPDRRELILAVGSEPEDGFDPTTGWGRYGSPLFQSTLLKRDQDLNIVHDLATVYQVSEDGLVWTVTLRDDVLFSDGDPLTADDVVYTFTTAANSGAAIDLTNLEKVEAEDLYTVHFFLKQPQSTFISHLTSTGIVPAHLHDSSYASNPVGSGPFKLLQWDRGQQLIVEANPDYYGSRPFFERLTFLFLAEDAAFAAARAGDADMAYIPSAFSQQSVAGMRLMNVESVDNRGILFPYVPAGEVTNDGRPIGNDVTADLAIRLAVNTAVDRQALVNGLLEGYGTPAYSVADKLPWWNPDTVIEDGDVERARQILADGGWIDQDGDGIVEKDGLKASFNLVYPSSDVTRQSLALAAADMVRPAGIEMIVEGKSWDEINRVMHSDAVMFGWGSHDPIEMYHLYSTQYQGISYFNSGFYSNPVVDEYMERALLATTEEEAIGYWQQAQWDGSTGFSVHGDAPWAWLVNINHLYLVNEHLDTGNHGIQPHGHGWPITDNIQEWRWKEQQ